MTMPATEPQAQETPAEAAPETTAAPDPIGVADGYQRWDFTESPAPETPSTEPAPDETAAPEEPKEPAPETAPEASDPAPDEIDDATWERVKNSSRVQRLVDNKYGNRLEQERQKARDEAAAQLRKDDADWQQATALYNQLSEDEEAFNAMVQQHGSPAVRRFMADYEEAAQVRQQSAGPQAQVIEKAKAEFAGQYTHDFNDAALGEVKRGLAATIPFYAELPDDTRKAIEAAAYNPEGNWMAEILTELGKGLAEREAKREREHKAALEQANEAGRNEQRAQSEERGPVIVKSDDAGGFTSFRQAEQSYAEGRMTYADFERLKKHFGRTI